VHRCVLYAEGRRSSQRSGGQATSNALSSLTRATVRSTVCQCLVILFLMSVLFYFLHTAAFGLWVGHK